MDPVEWTANAVSYLIGAFILVAVLWAFIKGNIEHRKTVQQLKQRKASGSEDRH